MKGVDDLILIKIISIIGLWLMMKFIYVKSIINEYAVENRATFLFPIILYLLSIFIILLSFGEYYNMFIYKVYPLLRFFCLMNFIICLVYQIQYIIFKDKSNLSRSTNLIMVIIHSLIVISLMC